MRVNVQNECPSVEDGDHAVSIDSIFPYGDEDGVVMKLALEDGRILIHFTTAEDLGRYPWSTLFRALNTDDTDDLIGKKALITVRNAVSKTTGSSFCNVTKVKLLEDK